MRLPVALAATALLAVTACGGSDEPETAPSSSASASAPSSSAPSSTPPSPSASPPSPSASTPGPADSSSGGEFSSSTRAAFTMSCQQSAVQTAGAGVDPAVITQACDCLLEEIQGLYTEEEFAAFEQRLARGEASDEETGRLTNLGAECGTRAAGG